MYSIILKLRNQHPKLLEIIRFLIVGTFATLIDMLVMAVFIYVFNKNSYNSFFDVFLNSGNGAGWSVVVATAIGFLVGLVVNYFLSLFYVYQGQNNFAKTKKGFLLFGVLSAIGLGIQTLGMYIGNFLLSINEWIVKIFLVVVVLIFNYITRKIFVFKNKDENIKEVNINISKEKQKLTDDEIKLLRKSIFLILFVINLVISLLTTFFINGVQWDYFFGCDSPRILSDWTDFGYNHYRTKVHPLYVLLIFPIFKLLTTFGCSVYFAVGLFNALSITFCEILLYKILKKLGKDTSPFYYIILTVIYCISFSTIENLLVVESFAVASVSLLLFFDWFSSVYYKDLTLKDYAILAVMGVVCFSMVVTNIMIYVICVLCLLFRKKRTLIDYLKIGLKLLASCVVSAILCYLLCEIQLKIFSSANSAFDYILSAIKDVFMSTRSTEEFAYMSRPSIRGILNVVLGFLGYSLSGGKLEYEGITAFFSINVLSLIVVLIVVFLLVVSIVFAIKKKNYIIFPIAISYFSQMLLHTVYGNSEIMLYTFQTLFLLFMIFICGLPFIEGKLGKTIKIGIYGLLCACFIGSFINNIKLIIGAYELFGINDNRGTFYRFLLNLLIFFILWILPRVFFKSNSKLDACKLEGKGNEKLFWLQTISLLLIAVFVIINVLPIVREKTKAPVNDVAIVTDEKILLGMGQRQKYVFTIKDSLGTFSKYDVENKEYTPIYENIKDCDYDPENYTITGKCNTQNYSFYENEVGIYVKINSEVTILDDSNYIEIPDFSEYSHAREMKILFHEVLVNVLPTGLTPNYITYGNVWYRDSAIMAMVLEKTGNKNQVKILANKNDVYDNARGGVKEPDNLGELLYLLSLQDERDTELINAVLAEAQRIKRDDGCIHGLTDGSELYVYQTIWLKFGMEKLGLDSSEYTVEGKSDAYSNMCWFYQAETPENYPCNVKDIQSSLFDINKKYYPYLDIARLHYYKVKIDLPSNLGYPISFEYQDWGLEKQAKCSPHGWTAAELFLYLMDYDSF